MIGALDAVYVADLILVKHDGTEVLRDRRIYLKPGPAKAMRTRMKDRGAWMSRTTLRNQFVSYRVEAYTITPNGYVDIP